MRRFLIAALVLFGCLTGIAQGDSLDLSKSMLKNLRDGDSIYYYQCHVEEATQLITTASGQTLTGKPSRYSITEKYVVIKKGSEYKVNYYTSAMTAFPNRRFSGLKIREKEYWLLRLDRSFTLNTQDLKVLLALERKGREANEYDYAITKYTTNQLIIRHRKDFKQLIIEGNYLLSKLILK